MPASSGGSQYAKGALPIRVKQSGNGTEEAPVGLKFARAALGALLGAGTVVMIALVATYLYGIPQFEGRYAMTVAFVWMPMGAIAGALFGLLLWKSSR
jgi:hypothetical protein